GDAPGLFAEAHGGTLFLDELGDMDAALQVKLLRVLETGELLPVGASRSVTVDVRIVSATHRPLAEMVAQRAFRDDLYWRVRGIEVALPRLADRIGDLPVLAQHFLNQGRALVPRAGPTTLSPGALRRLEAWPWPGNLRELRHEMQRAAPSASAAAEGSTLEEKIAALERREIAAALAATSGNRSHAAQRLGLSRQGLLNKMDRHGLK